MLCMQREGKFQNSGKQHKIRIVCFIQIGKNCSIFSSSFFQGHISNQCPQRQNKGGFNKGGGGGGFNKGGFNKDGNKGGFNKGGFNKGGGFNKFNNNKSDSPSNKVVKFDD